MSSKFISILFFVFFIHQCSSKNVCARFECEKLGSDDGIVMASCQECYQRGYSVCRTIDNATMTAIAHEDNLMIDSKKYMVPEFAFCHIEIPSSCITESMAQQRRLLHEAQELCTDSESVVYPTLPEFEVSQRSGVIHLTIARSIEDDFFWNQFEIDQLKVSVITDGIMNELLTIDFPLALRDDTGRITVEIPQQEIAPNNITDVSFQYTLTLLLHRQLTSKGQISDDVIKEVKSPVSTSNNVLGKSIKGDVIEILEKEGFEAWSIIALFTTAVLVLAYVIYRVCRRSRHLRSKLHQRTHFVEIMSPLTDSSPRLASNQEHQYMLNDRQAVTEFDTSEVIMLDPVPLKKSWRH